MLFALTVLAFMMIWKTDLHRIIFVKDRAQTAGDAAALAGARWQASTLNLIGELNLLHALAIENGDTVAQDMITNMQIRLCFAGPMAGVLAMQQAAKLNRIHVNEEFTEYMKDHAQTVRYDYSNVSGGHMQFAEPWTGAWEEYAQMIELVAADGIAAGVENHRRYSDYGNGHILTDKGFYRAVEVKDWCWFFLYHPGLLDSHTDYSSWPDLPPPDDITPQDCEYLTLHLMQIPTMLPRYFANQFAQQAEQMLGYDAFPPVTTQLTETVHNWMIYQPGAWGEWDAINRIDFPVLGTVKPHFNYAGADVVSRVHAQAARLTPNLGNALQVDEIVWCGAAKPFGYVTDDPNDDEANRKPPTIWNYVLPAFRAARLIPLDTASSGSPGGFDLDFRRHINEHLPVYLDTGRLEPGCRYCRDIGIFDDRDFRQAGIDWLRKNSGQCKMPPPGGHGGGGGGTRIGH